MSKNILIISSSPRKGGNSEMLCERFAAGAREAGHTVETVSLRDTNIHYCLGCEHCVSHPGECVHTDDMPALLEKMVKAHVLVLATPVYFYSMAAQLKTVIDRCVARYTEIKGKELYFLLTAADKDITLMKGTVEALRGFAYCLEGAEEKGIVYGLGAWKKGEIASLPAMEEAHGMGRRC